MEKKVRPIDANALARKIREYMRSLPASTARIMEYHKVLSMLGDEGQTQTLQLGCNIAATNESLTLEQLRGMDGQPVWVKDLKKPENSAWRLLYWSHGKYPVFISKSLDGHLFEEYGETWLAYAYPPAHIDREAWEPCPECSSSQNSLMKECYNCRFLLSALGEEPCKSCKNKGNWKSENKFCKQCGRPQEDEDWAELEKRLRGSVE